MSAFIVVYHDPTDAAMRLTDGGVWSVIEAEAARFATEAEARYALMVFESGRSEQAQRTGWYRPEFAKIVPADDNAKLQEAA